MYSRDEQFVRSLECYFCVYFPRCFATREINTQMNPLVSAETVRHLGTYIILSLPLSLSLSLSIYLYIYIYIYIYICLALTSLENIPRMSIQYGPRGTQ